MTHAPTVLVHEYTTGGAGLTGPAANLAGEGLAMLQAVLADFRAWGQVRTVTTLDPRLAGVPLAADRVLLLNPGDYPWMLLDLARQCDAVLLIAPERDGILVRLSAQVESLGVPLLGASAAAVAIAGDKWQAHLRFQAAGLPIPETWRSSQCPYLPENESPTPRDPAAFPLILKPIDGAGCESTYLVRDPSALREALQDPGLAGREALLQRYVTGAAASVSLLVAETGVVPLSLNRQCMRLGRSLAYTGGVVPFHHALAPQALELSCRAVSLIEGLRGYVGVDLVLAGRECYLIEINPRLTTSYIGLRRVININLAAAIWQACREGRLPPRVMLSGAVSFGKEAPGAHKVR